MAEQLGRFLRRLADRVDYENAPRAVGWRFRFEERVGILWSDDSRGCPVWYFPKDYEKAHYFDGSPDARG